MTLMLRIIVHGCPVPSSVAGKMTVWNGTLSFPMNCTSSTFCKAQEARSQTLRSGRSLHEESVM